MLVVSNYSLQIGSEFHRSSKVESVQTSQLTRTDASRQFECTSPDLE